MTDERKKTRMETGDFKKKMVCEFKDKAREAGVPLQEFVLIQLVHELGKVDDAIRALAESVDDLNGFE